MTPPIKRMNYFDRQFLHADDFAAEQRYHIDMRRLHNRLLHTWGIAEGLNVTSSSDKAAHVVITAGTAYDRAGREIILVEDRELDLSNFTVDVDVFVTITYQEQPTDQTDEAGALGATRHLEDPSIEARVSAPTPEEEGVRLLLAKVRRTGTAAMEVDRSKRRVIDTVRHGQETTVLDVLRGAVIRFEEGRNPPGFTRLPGLGEDIGPWYGLPDMPDGVVFVDGGVWTGTEVLCWNNRRGVPPTGARYNPTTNTWTIISTEGAPSAREARSVIWTGQELIVWGGWDANSPPVNTGARYNPSTDSWRTVTTTAAPTGRSGHCAVWTGREMIIWGGWDAGKQPLELGNTGARYDPATDSWMPMSTLNAPVPLAVPFAAVWTGQELIVWEGSASDRSGIQARYDPATDTWTPISPLRRRFSTRYSRGVWTGSEAIFIGSSTADMHCYNPKTDSWRSISPPYPTNLGANARPAITADGRWLITSAGIFDLLQNEWLTHSEPLNLASVLVNGQDLIGFVGDESFAIERRTGYRHSIRIIFPYIRQ